MASVTRNVPASRTDDQIAANLEGVARDQRPGALPSAATDRRGGPDAAAPVMSTPAAVTIGVPPIVVVATLSDADTRSRIIRTIACLAQLDSKHIEVDVDHHVVTLHGQVRCWSERQMVEQVAWASPAVSGVRNRLAVPY